MYSDNWNSHHSFWNNFQSRNGSFHRSPPVEDRLQDECPWGRNPQPKSGVRGSRNWMGGGQTILPSIQKNGHTKLVLPNIFQSHRFN